MVRITYCDGPSGCRDEAACKLVHDTFQYMAEPFGDVIECSRESTSEGSRGFMIVVGVVVWIAPNDCREDIERMIQAKKVLEDITGVEIEVMFYSHNTNVLHTAKNG